MPSIEHIQREQFEKCVARAHEFDDAKTMEGVTVILLAYTINTDASEMRRFAFDRHYNRTDQLPDVAKARRRAMDIVNRGLLILSLLPSEADHAE